VARVGVIKINNYYWLSLNETTKHDSRHTSPHPSFGSLYETNHQITSGFPVLTAWRPLRK